MPLLRNSATDLRLRLVPHLFSGPDADRLFAPRLLWYFIALGLAWRLWRYFLQFPIWPDEAFVCLNFPGNSYAGLAEPLRFIQIAPYLFLCAELTAYQWLGPSELSLRLVSIIASCVGLLLFARLARRLLEPDAAIAAVGILAVSYFCVQYAAEVKPYALDFTMSVGFLLLGYGWLRAEVASSASPRTTPDDGTANRATGVRAAWFQRYSSFVLLLLFTPVALGFSYPSVFVAGGVGLTLGFAWLRGPAWGRFVRLGLFGTLLVGSFLSYYLLVGVGQFRSAGSEQNPYWNEWFFPWHDPLRLPLWLWQTHAGALFAYPLGQRDGASVGTLLLFLVGLVQLCRTQRGLLPLLLIAPFALTLVASALGRYPYGGSARVAQHLAPSIILLAGLGGATTLRWLRTHVRAAHNLPLFMVAVLTLIALGGMVRDAWRPGKSGNDLLARTLPRAIAAWELPTAPIILLGDRSELMPSLEWYLGLLPNPIVWRDELPCDESGRWQPPPMRAGGADDSVPLILLALRRNADPVRFNAAVPPERWQRLFDQPYQMHFNDDPSGTWGRLRLAVICDIGKL